MKYAEWLERTYGGPGMPAPVSAARVVVPRVVVAVAVPRVARPRPRDERDRRGYVSPGKRGTCADCGEPMLRGTTSLPQGRARCLPCRRARPTVPSRRAPTRELVDACRLCGLPLDEPSRVRRYCAGLCADRARRRRKHGVRRAASPLYGRAHQKRRAETIGAAVGSPCVLCGEVMDDPARMHLDHLPDGSGWRGFAHDRCNVRDGARRGAAARARRQREAVTGRG